MKNKRSENDEMSGRIWKTMETEAKKTRVVKTARKRNEKEKRREMRKKEKDEGREEKEVKRKQNDGCKESSRRMVNMR